jgi:electron transfer flavoprotein beta subunit
MKILVCVKHVMESESTIQINDSGKWFEPSGSARFEMNRFDAYAIEEALLIKQRFSDSKIHAITVGPDHSQDTLRRALGMGIDEGIHISDNSIGYRPPFHTASWIAAYAKDKGYDLILTGIMSSDEMNCQTGPMISQLLSIPCCTATIQEKISSDKKTISVEREIEGGARDGFDIRLPCVLTIQTGINNPRYPSLSKVLRAKKKEIEVISSNFFGEKKQCLTLKNIQYPERKKKGVVLEGTIEDKVDQLMDILEKKAVLQ